MRKPPIPKIIITPPDDTGIAKKENKSECNEKDEIWIELEDMSPQEKKSADKSWYNTKNQKTNSDKKKQRMKMEKSQFKCKVIFKKL